MIHTLTFSIFLLLSMHTIYAADDSTTTFTFADKSKSKALLNQTDVYTDHFGKFDLQSKTQNLDGTLEDYLSNAQKQVRKWKKKEIKLIDDILEYFNERLDELNLEVNFPKEVLFLKTTMKEEGGASGYTRANYIVLNKESVKSSGKELEHLIFHELFHVLSRYDHELRKKLYQVIGFEYHPEIEIPQVLKDRYITNPDAPSYDSSIQLSKGEHTFDALMMIYSKRDYTGGSFFDYLNIGFVELKGEKENKEVYLKDGQPVIRGLNEVEGFFEQVGQNTEYIIDPEEIMADNFTFLIQGKEDLKNPEIVEKIKEILQR